jgi:hypothetical protein
MSANLSALALIRVWFDEPLIGSGALNLPGECRHGVHARVVLRKTTPAAVSESPEKHENDNNQENQP